MDAKKNKKAHYPEVNQNAKFPDIEKAMLVKWEKEGTFAKSLAVRATAPEYVFYDGPPFASGLPHYGHLFTGQVKDTVPRYQTMRGKRVERRFGWDCHGLPAEMEAEHHLSVHGRQAIIKYGIDRFNAACRELVMQYTGEWEKTTDRMARWVDFKNDYKTMDLDYMESVIWAFKQLYDKGLVYSGTYAAWYSYGTETVMSNQETKLDDSYREREDAAVTVMFALKDAPKPTKLLAWTTTPWTLPSNFALVVGPDIAYDVYEENGTQYVIGHDRVPAYKQQLKDASFVKTIAGKELVGKDYEPLFPFFKDVSPAFRVLAGDFVTTEDGTGIVHAAPFGEEDLELFKKEGVAWRAPVNNQGRFTDDVPPYAGRLVFDANDLVIRDLKTSGKLVKREQIKHNYPHCWRTDVPLIQRPMESWYIDVPRFKDRMLELNQEINWIPSHIRDGQFHNWLLNVRPWAVSRSRFWGTPLPIWQSDDPKYPRTDVYGSIAELERDFGVKVADLHRPFIDTLTRPNPDDPTGKSTMRRVEYVFDCWFESGSMPFAQVHYPFENKEWFETHFPADFIVEYVAQTRGWFYSLVAVATMLFDKHPFKNCVCHGVIVASDGKKLSKRLRNYPEPAEVFENQGADAFRWFLIGSPVLRGGNLSIESDGKDLTKNMRKAEIPLFNAFNFFCLYANAEGIKAAFDPSPKKDVLDNYILAKTKALVAGVTADMDAYDIPEACGRIEGFIDVLNNWYIRRSRARFWDGEDQEAFDTLYTVLVTLTKIAAPLLPMIAEYIYVSLTGGESVHLTDWPDTVVWPDAADLIACMDKVQAACSTIKAVRETHRLRNRLPLKSATVAGAGISRLTEFSDIIADEINVKELKLSEKVEDFATPFLYIKTPLVGRRLPKAMKDIIAASKTDAWKVNADKSLSIAGQTLSPDEYEYRLELKPGLAGTALPDNTAVVTVDVAVYPDLEEEGAARDFVRAVQQLRKDSGFDVSDRIRIEYSTQSGLIERALAKHRDYVMAQLLAVEFAEAPNEGRTEVVADGEVRVTAEKV